VRREDGGLFPLPTEARQPQRGQERRQQRGLRTGSKLEDRYYGQTRDFTDKKHVVTSFTIAPDGTPEWARDTEALWNAVEKKDDRKNSILVYEWEIARQMNWTTRTGRTSRATLPDGSGRIRRRRDGRHPQRRHEGPFPRANDPSRADRGRLGEEQIARVLMDAPQLPIPLMWGVPLLVGIPLFFFVTEYF
jgi:hypothetical protein